MQRRNFIKVVTLGSLIATNNILGDSLKSDLKINQKDRLFQINLKHNLKQNSKLWVPLLLNSEYQQVLGDYAISGNFKSSYISDSKTPTLYAEFENNNPNLDISFMIKTTERNTDFSKVNFNEKENFGSEISNFLLPTGFIPVNGIVKDKANEIIGKTKGDLEKARLIYDWVADNMQRDNNIPGCGIGDVKSILESGKLSGKCTDINSVFVGLCRASGIPAREIFGIRVGQSRFSDQMGKAENGFANITQSQHCRAEFYLKGYGWIPVDPADVTKVKLGEKLTNNDSKIKKIKEYLFGNWEMGWIGYNDARDFILNPRPVQFPINNFGYPYAEVDEYPLDYYDYENFTYNYNSKEIKI